jgi:Ca2+/H+ antiporter
MNGNIALSMEIGSAYALQVCLLQIPALVLYSAVNAQFIDPADLISHSFKYVAQVPISMIEHAANILFSVSYSHSGT